MELYKDVAVPQNEDVSQIDEGLREGVYFAVLGRTAKVNWISRDGSPRTAIQSDFFLISYSDQSADAVRLMEVSVDKEKTKVKFLSSKEGHPMIDWVYRHRLPDPTPSSTPRAVNFLKMMRKRYAQKLDAIENGVIDWTKIASLAGSIVSFNLTRGNSKYLNIELDSITLHQQPKVNEENLLALYKAYEAEVKRREALRQSQTPEAPPPPSDEDLPF